MKEAEVSVNDRFVSKIALKKKEKTNAECCAIEMFGGDVVDGRDTDILSAASTAVLNALKYVAQIDDDHHLISPDVLVPLQNFKRNSLGANIRLNLDETLIALAICASQDEVAQLALSCIDELHSTEMHSTIILPPTEAAIIKKLGINLTVEPVYKK